MRPLLRSLALPALFFVAACSQEAPTPAPLTGDWTLDGTASHLSFVTVKAGSLAEAHMFSALKGSVSANGDAKVEIGLASVATGVDVRDERMRSILFDVAAYPMATVTAKLDPAAYQGLAIGQTISVTLPAKLNLHGVEGDVEASLAVTRAGPDKVLVSTVKPIIVDADTFGLGEGVDKLRDLAKLPAITHAVPVTFTFAFTR